MNAGLPWSTVYALLRFQYENRPSWLPPRTAPVESTPVELSDDRLRSLIRFAGASMGNGDPAVPRHLEAYRVLQLVPEEIGAALFAEGGAA